MGLPERLNVGIFVVNFGPTVQWMTNLYEDHPDRGCITWTGKAFQFLVLTSFTDTSRAFYASAACAAPEKLYVFATNYTDVYLNSLTSPQCSLCSLRPVFYVEVNKCERKKQGKWQQQQQLEADRDGAVGGLLSPLVSGAVHR